MKSYTKFKSIPMSIFMTIIFASFIYYGINDRIDVNYYIIWLIMIFVMILVEYSTYRIDISVDKIVIHKMLRKQVVIEYNRITKIEIEGYIIRGRWLVISLYNGGAILSSAEIGSISNKGFIQDLIKYSAINNCIIETNEIAEKIVTQDFAE